MIITATQSNATVTPRKLRLVAFAIRHHTPAIALQELTFLNKEAARVLLKVLKQALANAKGNNNVNPADLTISEIIINKGRTYKRGRASARGRSKPYKHVQSHITIKLMTAEVKEIKEVKDVKKAVKPIEKKTITKKSSATVTPRRRATVSK